MHQFNNLRENFLEYFSKNLQFSPNSILEFIQFYNADFSSYDNEIYAHIGSRIAHWWNFQDCDWFSKRINLYLDFLETLVTNNKEKVLLIDVGFSVPYTYTRSELNNSKNLSSFFIDKYQSAKQFHKLISDFLNINRESLDQVIISDIEQEYDQENLFDNFVKFIKKENPSKILVVASEVIEHLDNPDEFWKLLTKIQTLTTASIMVYITLPVGKIIPSHTLEFLSSDQAINYVNQYLEKQKVWLLKSPDNSSPYLQECVCMLGKMK